MVELWCRKKHSGEHLCEDCSQLLEYAHARLDRCRFGNDKTKCHKCPVHCYKPQMRDKIRQVMRFSGPRMIFYHPFEAIMYLLTK